MHMCTGNNFGEEDNFIAAQCDRRFNAFRESTAGNVVTVVVVYYLDTDTTPISAPCVSFAKQILTNASTSPCRTGCVAYTHTNLRWD